MTAVNELLDNVKIRLNLASDMALAERLTVTRSLVYRWRKGDTPLADERIAQICALAKLDGDDPCRARYLRNGTCPLATHAGQNERGGCGRRAGSAVDAGPRKRKNRPNSGG